MDRQRGQKGLHFLDPKLGRVPLAMGNDEASNPVAIRLLGADAVVLDPDPVSEPVKQGDRRNRLHRSFSPPPHMPLGRAPSAIPAEVPVSKLRLRSTHFVRPRAGPHTSGELMFDHVKFGVSDYAASKAFFLKALEPLGVAVVSEGPPTYGVELSPKGEASLCLYQTEEKPAHLHLAFTAENRQQVEAFYRAALEAGGKDNGAPGLRPRVPRELLCSFRHWSGRAQHRSGLPRTRGL